MPQIKKSPSPSGPVDLLVIFVWNCVSFAVGFAVMRLMYGWDASSIIFGGAMLLFSYLCLTMYYFRHFHNRVVLVLDKHGRRILKRMRKGVRSG